MIKIDNNDSIEVNEPFQKRLERIFEVSKEYNLTECIQKYIIINHSKDNGKVSYELKFPKAFFSDFPNFQMKLSESAFFIAEKTDSTFLKSYSYHGFHCKYINDGRDHFLRFDFEPFKKKYPKIHINAPKKKWGDHLTFPDGTNLDISEMSLDKALKVFYLYASDKNDYPLNKETNQKYVKIFN